MRTCADQKVHRCLPRGMITQRSLSDGYHRLQLCGREDIESPASSCYTLLRCFGFHCIFISRENIVEAVLLLPDGGPCTERQRSCVCDIETRWSLLSFSTQAILWFCDILKTCKLIINMPVGLRNSFKIWMTCFSLPIHTVFLLTTAMTTYSKMQIPVSFALLPNAYVCHAVKSTPKTPLWSHMGMLLYLSI